MRVNMDKNHVENVRS